MSISNEGPCSKKIHILVKLLSGKIIPFFTFVIVVPDPESWAVISRGYANYFSPVFRVVYILAFARINARFFMYKKEKYVIRNCVDYPCSQDSLKKK